MNWPYSVSWQFNVWPPVQPPMLYIKMCVFKFYLRFWVAPLEIWCTTLRKFEKTFLNGNDALFFMVMSIIQQQILHLLNTSRLYSKLVFFKQNWQILIKFGFLTIHALNKIMIFVVVTDHFANWLHFFRTRPVQCCSYAIFWFHTLMRSKIFWFIQGHREDTLKWPLFYENNWHVWLCWVLFPPATWY